MLTFEKSMEMLVGLALDEDLGERGDITSKATIPAGAHLVGRITAKAPGVIAGTPGVESTYRQLSGGVTVRPCVNDGDHVSAGTVICEVSGPGQAVLTGERVALNFLQHLSGIATLTAQYVAAVAGTKAVILDTRKTTPGWRALEKYAVRCGGGQNHRFGLWDMVLVKDNHIEAAGSITSAVNAVRANPQAVGLPIIVEVENLDQLWEALELGVNRILLDNMTEAMMRDAVSLVKGRIPLEASGNMTLDRVAAVAAAGVDFISVGALTHSAPALDLSMRLEPVTEESRLESE
jgi:nicotinate-nucleotide pyrophosphorylase (carboxylating)